MNRRGAARGRRGGLTLCLLFLIPAAARAQDDPILRAMRDELKRSAGLRLANLEAPYYVEYGLHDGESLSMSATLGALVRSQRNRFRIPRVQVRVGDYKFDNTNYVFTDFFSGGGVDAGPMPVEDSYPSLRHYLWLSTDRAYKGALQSIARKRAALQHMSVAEELSDFARVEPAKTILDFRREAPDEEQWKARLRAVSELFAAYPFIVNSAIDFEAVQGTFYFADSEGAEARVPEKLMYVRVLASALAPDGMALRQAAVVYAREFAGAFPEPELNKVAREVAESLSALAAAPIGEPYSGPVLFEDRAAAQLFAEVLGRNLATRRRPVAEPGRPLPFVEGEFDGRIGSRILPKWMDVVDDPTQVEWRGRPLLGQYRVDMEGVPARPVRVVEKGVLRSLLTTRQPGRGMEGSNGRARLPGGFGAKAAAFSNLFVRASESAPPDELRRKLIEMCRRLNKPYGIIVRKMDFPSSAGMDEFRRMAAKMAQTGTGRAVSQPVLVYRLYPDGREELVRGLRFRGVTTRSLRDIVAASEETTVFDFLDNMAPFAWMGAAGYVAESSVIAPSALFEDLQLEKADEEIPKPPVVPPPALATAK